MNIGIDIDGVLVDLYAYIRSKGDKFFYKKYGIRPVSKNGYTPKEIYKCTKKQHDAFWIRHILHYALFTRSRPYASYYIASWMKNYNEVYIITGRCYTEEKSFRGFFFRTCVRIWLKFNGIPYSELVFSGTDQSKRNICKKYGIDIMIDDQLSQIDSMKGVCDGVCYRTPYNSAFLNDERLCADDFQQINTIIKNKMEEIK